MASIDSKNLLALSKSCIISTPAHSRPEITTCYKHVGASGCTCPFQNTRILIILKGEHTHTHQILNLLSEYQNHNFFIFIIIIVVNPFLPSFILLLPFLSSFPVLCQSHPLPSGRLHNSFFNHTKIINIFVSDTTTLISGHWPVLSFHTHSQGHS